jgi:hypothetical protein
MVLVVRLLAFGTAVAFLRETHLRWLWLSLCTVILLPSALLGAVLIPTGVPYVSYYFTLVFRPWGIAKEVRGGAVFNELQARLRSGRKLDSAEHASLGTRLFRGFSDKRVRGANLASRAILDALAGDRESARALFFVAQGLAPHNASRAVRAYAQSWLLVDAGQRGAFHELVALSALPPRTRRRWFLRAASRRVLGLDSAAKNAALTWLWLLAPGRLGGASLLRAAKEAQPRSELSFDAAADALTAARTATLTLTSWPKGWASRADVSRLADLWQRVFDSDQLQVQLRARREALEASFATESVSARIERDVIGLLAKLWRESQADLQSAEDEPRLLTIAKDQLQEPLLDELESLAEALPHGDARNDESLETLWRTWTRIRWRAHEFCMLLPERSSQIHETVGLRALNYGAWLFNREQAHVLAHEVFRWLHSIAPDQSENRATLARNMKLSRPA